MKHTKGELHRHGLEIHIKTETEHYCIANMNPNVSMGEAYEEQAAQAQCLINCWNCHDDLLAACKAFMELLAKTGTTPQQEKPIQT